MDISLDMVFDRTDATIHSQIRDYLNEVLRDGPDRIKRSSRFMSKSSTRTLNAGLRNMQRAMKPKRLLQCDPRAKTVSFAVASMVSSSV